jgi:hypothetical protein
MPRTGPRLPLVAFKTGYGPSVDEFARQHGLLKRLPPDDPEPNRSEALNVLVGWALEHYPEAGTPEAEALKKSAQRLPKLTDRDRAVLEHLRTQAAGVTLQSDAVDPETNTVAMQTVGRLARLGLVETVTDGAGRVAELTDAGRELAEFHVATDIRKDQGT